MNNKLVSLVLPLFVACSCYASDSSLSKSLHHLYQEQKIEQLKKDKEDQLQRLQSTYSNKDQITQELIKLGLSSYELQYFSERIAYEASTNPNHFKPYRHLDRISNPWEYYLRSRVATIIRGLGNLGEKDQFEVLSFLYSVSQKLDTENCTKLFHSPDQLNLNPVFLSQVLSEEERKYFISFLEKSRPNPEDTSNETEEKGPKGGGGIIGAINAMYGVDEKEQKELERRWNSEIEKVYSTAIERRLSTIKPERRTKILKALVEPKNASKLDYCDACIFNLGTVLMNGTEKMNEVVLSRFLTNCHVF